jgi:hypothetical protein
LSLAAVWDTVKLPIAERVERALDPPIPIDAHVSPSKGWASRLSPEVSRS